MPHCSRWIRRSTVISSVVAAGLCAAALVASATAQQPSPAAGNAGPKPPNILLIIGDDIGIEAFRAFGVGTNPPPTPNLDRLAAEGVRFNNYWSQPVCSPTRATMLTGRYGFRTGVGRPTGDYGVAGPWPEPPAKPAGAPREAGFSPPATGEVSQSSPGLRLQEFTLPKAFAAHPERGYATAAIGKWHLADRSNGWERHPNLAGFDHFAGPLRGYADSHFAWNQVVNGTFSGKTGYADSDKVDDAVAWIRGRGDRPWFVWLALNLAHTPNHVPPRSLWVSDHSKLDPRADPAGNPRPYFEAMVEAMDTEIGRVLASLDPATRANTYVVFMGDNGTPGNVITAPFTKGKAKASVYEGGVNVPLIVAGPGVARNRASNALVNSVDMFATIMEMAGIKPAGTIPSGVVVDAVSFHPYLSQPDRPSIRQWIYADVFGAAEGLRGGKFQGGQYAIRNATYKLVANAGKEEFYDVTKDRSEMRNLLGGTLTQEQQAAYASLRSQVDRLHASEQTSGQTR